jgi:two-component system chemotaxis response regulator CheY
MAASEQASSGSTDEVPADRRHFQALAPTILVVDDDADIRASICDLLHEHGYATVSAENGRKAQEYLGTHPAPACLILDLWMPEVDGLTLATQILSGPLPHVPIILVTAGSSDRGYPVPSRYVMRKPLDSDRLLRLVSELARPRVR